MLNMNKIEFSIIIPVYNQEKYIEKCLQSAVNQNFDGNFEIIAINDGSCDKSGKLLDKFHGNEKVKIYNNENRGVSYSRNFGLEEAKGEYIIFLDADDYLDINALRNFKKANPDNNADIILAPFYGIRENRGDIKKYLPTSKKLFISPKGKNIQNTNGKILESNFELCTKAYRKRFLEENNVKFLPYKAAEDLPFFYQTMLKAQNIIICQEPVYFYRKGHKKWINKEVLNEVINAILKTDEIVKSYSEYKKIKFIYLKNSYRVLLYWCKQFKNLPNKGEFYMFSLKLFIRNLIDI